MARGTTDKDLPRRSVILMNYMTVLLKNSINPRRVRFYTCAPNQAKSWPRSTMVVRQLARRITDAETEIQISVRRKYADFIAFPVTMWASGKLQDEIKGATSPTDPHYRA